MIKHEKRLGMRALQRPPDDPYQVPFEAAKRLLGGLAFGPLLVEVGTSGWMNPRSLIDAQPSDLTAVDLVLLEPVVDGGIAHSDDPKMLSAHRAEREEIELGFGAPIPEW